MATFTAPVALNLTTPRAVTLALAELGLGWEPIPLDVANNDRQAGLYAWVDGLVDELAVDLVDRGVLYWGIGTGAGGAVERVRREIGFVGPNATHAHGITVHRRAAVPIAAPVTVQETDLGWLTSPAFDIKPEGAAIALHWLEEIKDSPSLLIKAVEHLAIRIAIHFGDTGAPVNSTHAGAWEDDSPADWAAWGVVQHLAGRGADTAPAA
ncbi:hypothetical protein [Streptomyces sp. NPDC001401]|uniref:hypothetical protein n=1 Tax=Streptomyces sp. NPDC001401 TaxID=3364570 RepID=UPI0036C57CFE